MSAFAFPRTKVCGLTTAADAVTAYTAGAGALGVVHFPPSPRSIDAAAARAIVEELPFGAVVVAVMVDPAPEQALRWCERAGVSALQLCGGEAAQDFAGFPLPLLRRIGVSAGAAFAELEAWRPLAAGFVLDHPASPGGSGLAVEHAAAAALVTAAAPLPCLLAGGLDPDNVAAAIAAVGPHGADASSRLEAAPGRKDPVRVRAFLAAAEAALQELRR